MIIEARCRECGRHIGFISTQSVSGDSKYLGKLEYAKQIRHKDFVVGFMCDQCRDGVVELGDGGDDND